MDTQPSPANFRPCQLWPNGCMHLDTTWYEGRPQPRRHCVRWGPSFPSRKWAQLPQFSAHVRCGQTTGWTKMPLGMEVDLDASDFVLNGDQLPHSQKKGTAPTQFSAHVYCGQTAVCIWMPLGTKVGLGLGDIVLDGDPAFPPVNGHSPPVFGPCPLWPNDWMD